MKVSMTIINDMPHYSIEGVTFLRSLTTDRFIKDGNRTWRLSTHPTVEGVTFYSFGITDPINPPGHGGEWSSNTYHINNMFGVDLIECDVDRWACAIDKKELSILNQALSYLEDNNMMCDISNDYVQACQEMGPEDYQSWEDFAFSRCLGVARREFAKSFIWM